MTMIIGLVGKGQALLAADSKRRNLETNGAEALVKVKAAGPIIFALGGMSQAVDDLTHGIMNRAIAYGSLDEFERDVLEGAKTIVPHWANEYSKGGWPAHCYMIAASVGLSGYGELRVWDFVRGHRKDLVGDDDGLQPWFMGSGREIWGPAVDALLASDRFVSIDVALLEAIRTGEKAMPLDIGLPMSLGAVVLGPNGRPQATVHTGLDVL